MKLIHFVSVSTMIVACASQRSPYAGLRPIGIPEIETTTSASSQIDPLGNRVGETTTTQRLPVEALGDRNLVNRLGQLPQDKQPFWFLNWQALEANRKQPQTYPQRPNLFVDETMLLPNLNTRRGSPTTENQNNLSQSNNTSQSSNTSQTSNTSQRSNTTQSSNTSQRSTTPQSSNTTQRNENSSTTSPSTETVART